MSGRKRRNSIVMWIVLVVMVIAMAGFGLNSTISSSTSSTVFKVGETEITAEEYGISLNNAIEGVARQQGQPLTMDEARLMGIPQQIKTQLINQATLSEIARVNNIIPSDEDVAKALLQIDAFHDSEGAFNRRSFDLFLDSRGQSENEFLEGIRNNLERNMVLDVLDAQDLKLNHLNEALYAGLGEKRAVSYITITPENLNGLPEISEDAVRAKYEQDPQQYLGDPKRVYQIAYLAPEAEAVSDADIQAYYQDNPQEFGQEAQVSYRVMSFPDEASAQAFYENPDFEALAAERGLEEADYVSEDQVVSSLPEGFQDAVARGETKLYPPVQSLLGWNVYDITSFEAATQQPLTEVEDRIRTVLASENVNAQLTTEYDNIVNSVAGGASLKELADSSPLNFVEWSNEDAPIAGLTDTEEFAGETRVIQVGEDRELVKLSNGGIFIVKLLSEDEPQVQAFEAVQDSIRAELLSEQTSQAMDARVEEIKAQAESESLEAVAQAQGFEIVNVEPVSSQESYDALPFSLAFDLFRNEPSTHWVGFGDNATRYIATITDVTVFDPETSEGQALIAQLSEQVDASLSEGMIVDYLNAAAKEYGAIEYPALIQQVEDQFR